jgi:acyl-CoA synthetase (AMP-forming)/AMP-acid ligase II
MNAHPCGVVTVDQGGMKENFLSETVNDPATLVELLRGRAWSQPERRVFTYLADGEEESDHLTYAELDRAAASIGALLQRHYRPGERALLLYQPGLDFVTAFLGCLYAGVVAAPVSPPHLARLNRALPKLQAIAADAEPAVVLTTTRLIAASEQIAEAAPVFKRTHWLATDGLDDLLGDGYLDLPLTGDTLAYLQYTSGSTAAPKGVMVTHGNLLHNLAYIAHGFKHTPDSALVSWLPAFHDMGLIYGMLQPIYLGSRCYVMPPAAFIQRPYRWLQAMSRYRATHSMAPNFAYDLCVRKVTETQRAALDLSGWQVAVNGAEPVRKETLDRFAEYFAPCGFRRSNFYPGYGLAEATLKVTGGRVSDEFMTCSVETAALEQHRVLECEPGSEGARTLVSCGRPMLDVKVAVIHPERLTRCAPDEVGEIWVSGPSCASGYWNRPVETQGVFRAYPLDGGGDLYLRTGDLGFLRDGELYITGRIKDLVIIGGANHYPQDIELTVGRSHPALRPNSCAAFSVEADGAERLVVAVEVERRLPPERMDAAAGGIERARLPMPDREELIRAIQQAVSEEHGLEVYRVVLLKAGDIPKTSSGKIQRQACRRSFLEQGLEEWACAGPAAAMRATPNWSLPQVTC